MKKLTLTVALMGIALFSFAQNDKPQETKYRRSSLYSLMLPDKDLTGYQKDIVTATYENQGFPEKYNNFCLSERILNLDSIKQTVVSEEAIAAAKEQTEPAKSKLGRFAKKGFKFMKDAAATATSIAGNERTSEKIDNMSLEGALTDDQYVAKLKQYFDNHHFGGKMVAKWFGGTEEAPAAGTPLNTTLIEEMGINTLSTDELEKAKTNVGGKEKLVAAAQYDLMGRTFITVNKYSYLSAEEVIAMLTAATQAVGVLPGAELAGAGLAAVLKGYFVKTTTYLFQLDLDKDKINNLVEKYANDISGLYTANDVEIKYVGKTWDYAPATLKLTTKDAASDTLIAHATLRATDGAIAKLQKKYDQFKTLSTLHQDGDKLYAFVGTKEGCEEGTKFEVLQKTINDEGMEVFEKVDEVKIQKGELWDNRPGAGASIEGGATGKDDSGANPALTFSGLGKSKKLLEGSLLRQVK